MRIWVKRRCIHRLPAIQNSTICKLDSTELKALYRTLLKECGSTGNLANGRQVHEHMVRTGSTDRFLSNMLVEMYGKCGSLVDAKSVFDGIYMKNVYTWTIMIAALLRNGKKSLAMKTFLEMDLSGTSGNDITYLAALDACSGYAQARGLYESAVSDGSFERSGFLRNAVISTFSRLGRLCEASSVFESIAGTRDLVTWNAMISAFAQNGHYHEAIKLYERMDVEPDSVTFISVIDACSSLKDLERGKELHEKILARTGMQTDGNLRNALISFYGRCASVHEARKVFDSMPDRDTVSWNAMLAAYAQNGQPKKALELYQEMDKVPNQVTFLAVLDACASLTELSRGKAAHWRIRELGLEADAVVGNSLVYLYAKCGSVPDAKLAFDRIGYRDVFSWTALIAAHCQNGLPMESLELFLQMQHEGVVPDRITYVSILSACSYAGLVLEAREHFLSIYREYTLSPSVDNFCCMVDVFSRAGWLEHAEELIHTMPFPAHVVTWTMLLGACNVYGDVERGKRVADQASRLDPIDRTPQLLLSNLYAVAGS